MNPIAFTILGVPQPKGSAQGFAFFVRNAAGRLVMNPKTGLPRTRVAITSDNPKVKRWQKEVARAAGLALGGVQLEVTGAVQIEAWFYLPPPIKIPKARAGLPSTKPDLDKCLRAVLDALTGVFYADDAQVVDIVAHKRYSDTPAAARLHVVITPIEAALPLFAKGASYDADRHPDISQRRFGAAYP